MKSEDGQVFLSTADHMEHYKKLKSLKNNVENLSGDYWNWPIVTSLTRPTLARLLNLNFLYDKMMPCSGSICEFGVHYGASLATLINLRSIKEPNNYSRHVYGFDTFEGFKGVTEGKDAESIDGDFNVAQDYEKILNEILTVQESLSPNNHIKKFSLIKGDASETINDWLKENPHSIISMAIFDMDIYKPTRDVLHAIKDRFSKGSIIVFDELNCPHFPGETEALIEVFGMNTIEVKRSPFLPYNSYVKI